jgi:DNA modification methylase
VWGGDANLFYPLRVASQWKPILVYSKGPWHRRERWPDVLRVTVKEKDWHRWQQPLDEVERLVSYFSRPGDLVVDPCGGGFTTAEACLRLARRCVSCDRDPECVGKGQKRLEEARRRMRPKAEA